MLFASLAIAAEPTADDLKAGYEKTVRAFERVAYRAEVKVTYDGPKLRAGQLLEASDYQVWRDGNRQKLLLSETRHFPGKQGMEKRETSEERLFPGKGYIRVATLPMAVGVFAHAVRARLNELADTEKWMVYQDPIAVLNGRVKYNGTDSGPLTLPEVLGKSKLSARKVNIDDKLLWVLEATGKWGSHTLWLDPAAGYLANRIEQRKKGADWGEFGKPLDSLQPYPEGDAYFPAGRLTESTIIVDGVSTKRFGAVDVPIAFTVRDTKRFDNGQAVTLTSSVRVREVDFDPDFAKKDLFTISSPIADGTPVTVADEPNIAYQWRDGKIVKRVDP